jgi:hypothetical protein
MALSNGADPFLPLVQSLKQVYKIINASKIARHLDPTSDESGQASVASGHMKRYFETLPVGKCSISYCSIRLGGDIVLRSM